MHPLDYRSFYSQAEVEHPRALWLGAEIISAFLGVALPHWHGINSSDMRVARRYPTHLRKARPRMPRTSRSRSDDCSPEINPTSESRKRRLFLEPCTPPQPEDSDTLARTVCWAGSSIWPSLRGSGYDGQ